MPQRDETPRECSGMRRGGACYVRPPNFDVCVASKCPKRWPSRRLAGRTPIPGASYLPGGPVPYTPAEWAALHAASVRIAAPIRCEVQDAAGRRGNLRTVAGVPLVERGT